MRPIQLRIRKAMLVPTKRAIIHSHRTDWITVGVITYDQCSEFFRAVDGSGAMSTDSHLAYWIYRMFGEGEYSLVAFQKGRKGFWNFMKLQCRADGYIRTKRKETQEDREKRDQALELRRLNRGAKHAIDSEERGEIQKEIDELKEDLEITKEILELDAPAKSGCYPFLKSVMPVYRFHEYEDWTTNNVPQFNTETQQTGGYESAW